MNEPAGFWVRLGASILDSLILTIPIMILSSLIIIGDMNDNDLVRDTLSTLYSLLLPVLWGGYTLGKRICNVRIRKVSDQSPPTIGTMLLRVVVGAIVYGITFGIGVIVSIFMISLREDKRSLHDLIAGTEVVYD